MPFTAKFTEKQLIAAIAPEPPVSSVRGWQIIAEDKLGMSMATFWRYYRRMTEEGRWPFTIDGNKRDAAWRRASTAVVRVDDAKDSTAQAGIELAVEPVEL